jgi:selenocysteine lyase/cysteine desulfurase
MNSNPDVFFRRILRINMDETMKCIADFVNADTEDLVFVQNATTGNFLFLNIRQYSQICI